MISLSINSSVNYSIHTQRTQNEEATESASEKIAEANGSQSSLKTANATVGKGTNIDTVA